MSSFKYFSQHDSTDCGPSCLRMITEHYGRSISLQKLKEKSGIGRDGVNLLGISEAAEAIGFRTQAVRLSYESLVRDAGLPAILHWNQNHFVVLYKIRKNKLFIADPSKGLVKYTAPEFKSCWYSSTTEGKNEGIALLLEPGPQFHKNGKEETPPSEAGELRFKNIFLYILPYKKLVFQIFLGLAIASLLQLFLPFLTQSVIDTGVETGNIHFVFVILLAQFAAFGGRMAIEIVRGWILLHISCRINISILTDFLIKLMKLPASFFDIKHTGDILQRMDDHDRIESFLTGSSLNVLFSLLNLLILSVVLAIFNTGIFMVFATSAILYSAWVVCFLRRRRSLDYQRFEMAAKEQSVVIQTVQGMQEIKLNGVERQMRWVWERLQARLFKLSVRSLSLNQWQQAGGLFINEGKNILITFLSARAVIQGQMSLGSMLAIQYIIGQLNSPIEQMIGFVQSIQNAKISMERLNEIHNLEDEEPEEKYLLQDLPAAFTNQSSEKRNGFSFERKRTSDVPGELTAIQGFSEGGDNLHFSQPLDRWKDEPFICLRNLSFTYPGAGNEAVLKNINLEIPRGKTTAIVGVSGSGKTTLLKLLLKLYEPQKGEIILVPGCLQVSNDHSMITANDSGHFVTNEERGLSLSNISHKIWRSHCGVVMQESFIFSDTIVNNIAVGADRVDMNRLLDAVESANVREFIESLPLGFNTKIGAEGIGISMGQKQRILIARAVYRNPQFIFFDEATNSLDASNENIILRKLNSFFRGRTVVIVAHRLSTVKNADQIVVLNNGIISEKGTHQELVSIKGEYYTLIRNQLELGI